jgi:FtsP/CotA-like multicopper oxidase with cupredoxin domain
MELLEDRLVLTGDPFVEPPLIQSQNGVLTATLVMREGATTVGDTAVTNAWTYELNGVPSYVGPTLSVNPGDLIDLVIENRLPAGQTTNLHTHGLHVSPVGNSDNVLLQIEPGEDNHYKIHVPENHPEGLYWYHPHLHGTVNTQIMMGLSGLLVIGRADGGPTQLDGLPQRLLALKNALIVDNELEVPMGLATDPNNQQPDAQTFTVNGQLLPDLEVPVGQYQVFNVGNVGNNAFYDIRLFNVTNPMSPVSVPLLVVSRDGNPFTNVIQGGGQGTPPGRRFSFTFPPPSSMGMAVAGTYELRTNGFNDGTNSWPQTTLMTITYTGPSIPLPPAPVVNGQALSPPNQNFVDLRGPDVEIAATRTVVFTEDGDMAFINGEQFPDPPLFQPRLNTVEEWHLINQSGNDHPFHLHVNPQQVVAGGPAGANPDGLPFYQDVINVPAGTTEDSPVKIRIQFLDFLGEFVYHCHRVDHEDMGMMALVKIIPEEPIYAVGANADSKPKVKVFNPFSATPDTPAAQFLAFPPTYRGGVNVAVGDVNGDGVYDVIVGKGQNKTQVKVFDGTKLDQINPQTGELLPSALLATFLAYHGTAASGVFVSAAYYDGDDKADVITGPGRGTSPTVKVVDVEKLVQVSGSLNLNPEAILTSFDAFGVNFLGGVRVAAGDIEGNGRFDIVAGKGPGSDPRVKVFTGLQPEEIASFLAYGENFRGGVYVATGNTKGFAFDDIITGKGEGGDSLVRIFSNDHEMDHMDAHDAANHRCHDCISAQHDESLDLVLIDEFFAYEASYRGGVRVTSLNDNHTMMSDIDGTIYDLFVSCDSVVTTKATGDGTVPKITRCPRPPEA